MFILYISLFISVASQGKIWFIPRGEKSINDILNQWHLKSRWHIDLFIEKQFPPTLFPCDGRLGRIKVVLVSRKVFAQIAMNNPKREEKNMRWEAAEGWQKWAHAHLLLCSCVWSMLETRLGKRNLSHSYSFGSLCCCPCAMETV